ncbi:MULTISPECIES: SH3 domain-containing protein [unclassified Bartonella]|uniref:SH3 domain-containing protein n=1 Tax=unclassified Bartonella TaxID=2645622 RepID=UPI00300E1ECB
MKILVIFFVLGTLFLTTAVAENANVVVTKNLNLRTGPSTQYAICGLIPAGQLISVQICKGNWCHIKYNDQKGWVSSRYLSFKNGNDLYRTYTVLSTISYSYYP